MFKALLLQQWFNLSDRGLAEAIADRLSFQSFLGLSITDPVPDDTTFTRFRQKLQEKGVLEELFSILDSEFDRLGLLVKRGSFIDATIVQAQRRPPSKEKADKEKEEERDLDSTQIHSSAEEGDHSSHDERAKAEAKDDALKITENGKAYYATDPDARWTVKRGKLYYGYKVHVKRCYNLDRFPYVGLLPNKVKAFMTVMAMNIKRAFNIIQTHKNALSSCGSA
jgi:IS5 family transposase